MLIFNGLNLLSKNAFILSLCKNHEREISSGSHKVDVL